MFCGQAAGLVLHREGAAPRDNTTLIDGFGGGRCPVPLDDLPAWEIEAHRVVPSFGDRQVVRLLGVSSKVDGDTAIFVGFRGDVIQ